MSHPCRNCGRDVNNNYMPYTNAYSLTGTNRTNGKAFMSTSSADSSTKSTNNASFNKGNNRSEISGTGNATAATQITAKVMFGSVGAIKDLREKEQAEKNSATRASGRRHY